MNIALIGPRGSGKTRISQKLSQKTKWPIYSLDSLISYENNGISIPEFLARHNDDWRAFREEEFKVLEKTAKMENVIIDCGGGIVIDLDAQSNEVESQRKIDLLRSRATVFFLHPPLEQVISKIKGDEDRPDLGQQAEEVYHRRLPIYRSCCHHEIKVKKVHRDWAAEEILKILEEDQ